MEAFLNEKDVFGLVPTGFGKNLIFHLALLMVELSYCWTDRLKLARDGPSNHLPIISACPFSWKVFLLELARQAACFQQQRRRSLMSLFCNMQLSGKHEINKIISEPGSKWTTGNQLSDEACIFVLFCFPADLDIIFKVSSLRSQFKVCHFAEFHFCFIQNHI